MFSGFKHVTAEMFDHLLSTGTEATAVFFGDLLCASDRQYTVSRIETMAMFNCKVNCALKAKV
jgi:hypothetical protein